MSFNVTDYRTPGTQPRLLSPDLWHNCPIEFIQAGRVDGTYFFDDFVDTPVLSTTATTGRYTSYADTGGTITAGAVVTGDSSTGGVGILNIATDGTDADEVWITLAGNTGASFVVPATSTADTAKKLWFEARMTVDVVTDDYCHAFVGLCQQGRALGDTLVDNTGALGDFDFLGFRILADDGDTMDFMYAKSSDSVDGTQVIAAAKTITASTFFKIGFCYDPGAKPAERISCWIDGVKQSTYITQSATENTTLFPGGEELTLLAGHKNGTANAVVMSLDWWACAQLL